MNLLVSQKKTRKNSQLTKWRKGQVVSARPGAATTEEEKPHRPSANHLLTPGSSLTSSVWTAFNVIMVWLFVCWLLFLFSFPTSIHVWAFGILGLGLLISTNWFMSEIFKAGLDFDSQQAAKQQDGGKKAVEAVDSSAAPVEDKAVKAKPQPAQPKQKQQQQQKGGANNKPPPSRSHNKGRKGSCSHFSLWALLPH